MEPYIMAVLALTSVISVAFIIERGLALRHARVIPPSVREAAANCRTAAELPMLRRICEQQPAPLSRLLAVAVDHLDRPRAENVDAVQSCARREIAGLERGLVVLEIITGIAPLLGLVGTIYGLITLFASVGQAGLGDNTLFAKGIALALNATLMGLVIAIPSLVAWNYYSKRVETLAIEMESLCEEFIRQQYRNSAPG